MMKKWWAEKPDFWHNKTNDNDIYVDQKRELAAFIKENFAMGERDILDVGGYKGKAEEYLSAGGLRYTNYDIVSGFDITKDWDTQTGGHPKYFDLSFTSLVLICFPPEKVRHILREMLAHTREGIIIYEQFDPEQKEVVKQVSDEYGGKWIYNWEKLIGEVFSFDEFRRFDFKVSKVNPRWKMGAIELCA